MDKYKLHPYQKEILKLLRQGKRFVVLPPRRYGINTIRNICRAERSKD